MNMLCAKDSDIYLFEYNLFDGQITFQYIEDLHRQHIEADTCIVLHVKHACEQMVKPSIVFNCMDTDILIILLFPYRK